MCKRRENEGWNKKSEKKSRKIKSQVWKKRKINGGGGEEYRRKKQNWIDREKHGKEREK